MLHLIVSAGVCVKSGKVKEEEEEEEEEEVIVEGRLPTTGHFPKIQKRCHIQNHFKKCPKRIVCDMLV